MGLAYAARTVTRHFLDRVPGMDAATREHLAAFIRAVGRHRHYEREADPPPV